MNRDAPRNLWIGLVKVLVAFVLVGAPLLYFKTHYRIYIDPMKGDTCLEQRLFLIKQAEKTIHRGDYVAFSSVGMGPFYEDGTRVVKIVAGMPGDEIDVSEFAWVAGVNYGELMHVKPDGKLWALGKRPADYVRKETIPPGKLFVIGTHPRSYDSRYWGYVDETQVIARAYPIF